MIEINLVPDIKQELLKAELIRAKVIIGSIILGIISVSVVTILALYVFTVQQVRSSLADKDIKNGSAKLSAVEDLSKTLTIQNQLTKISQLNSSKNIDSRIFEVLNTVIPPAPNDIQISSLTVDSGTGMVVIDGQAVKSYEAVEVFKKTIEGATLKYTDANDEKQSVPLASNISTSNTSYGENSLGIKVLRFKFSFIYATELFSPESKDVKIYVTINGNVTDSYLGVPRSIFAAAAKDITGEQ